MSLSLELKGISKIFNNFSLAPVNIYIPSKTIVGLVGRNGAGKTTLLKSIIGLYYQETSRVYINGCLHNYNSNKHKQNIIMLSETNILPKEMDVKTIGKIYSSLYKKWDNSYFYRIIKDLDVPQGKKIKELSLGNKKKLAIGAVLATNSPIILLDEPTSNVDVVTRELILKEIKYNSKMNDAVIVFSSHLLADVKHITDKLLLLRDGQVTFYGNNNDFIDENFEERVLELIK